VLPPTMHLSSVPEGLDSHSIRLLCRENTFTATTAGYGPGEVQANLLIVHREYADDFRGLCRRNPVTCPLLGECRGPGDPRIASHLAQDGDVTTDAPGYNVSVCPFPLPPHSISKNVPGTKTAFSRLPTSGIARPNGQTTA
jgi:uncharacterized protein YcsI (UPF0317 family)